MRVQGPLRACLWAGHFRLPYYCAPFVCVPSLNGSRELAVWWLTLVHKQTNKPRLELRECCQQWQLGAASTSVLHTICQRSCCTRMGNTVAVIINTIKQKILCAPPPPALGLTSEMTQQIAHSVVTTKLALNWRFNWGVGNKPFL